MAAPWDRRAQRAEIPKLAITPAIPPFPGQAATVGIGTSGRLPGSAKPDHTHPAQDTSDTAGLTDNRVFVFFTTGPVTGGGFNAPATGGTTKEDPQGAWNGATGTWTAPADGVYLFIFKVKYGSAPGGVGQTTTSAIVPVLHSTVASARMTQLPSAVAPSDVPEYVVSYRSYKGQITAGYQMQFWVKSSAALGANCDISILYLGA